MPIYLVTSPQGKKLVDAPNRAQAINHVSRNSITAENIKASQIVELMQSGLPVEKATATQDVTPEPIQ